MSRIGRTLRRWRDAATGRYTTKGDAARRPRETVGERIPPRTHRGPDAVKGPRDRRPR